jgi:hypothetical protein
MKFRSALLLAALAAAPAAAQSNIGSNTGSNIGLAAYPAPKCDKPAPLDPNLKPARPVDNPNPDQADAYNNKVRKYNEAVRARNAQLQNFAACMKTYVDAANADIKRIQGAVDAAVAAANEN